NLSDQMAAFGLLTRLIKRYARKEVFGYLHAVAIRAYEKMPHTTATEPTIADRAFVKFIVEGFANEIVILSSLIFFGDLSYAIKPLKLLHFGKAFFWGEISYPFCS